MSRTRDIRQMSPAPTSCDMSRAPSGPSTRTLPAAGTMNVVGCEPYSSAFCAISPTLGTEPMVAGSRAPLTRQSSNTAAYMRP
ncbi:MAG: hypothetical protein BWY91_01734 [bacterium ADurb.BinA028]|nr:MAG: hypothetical protein BWY91_01734 [bacterium ADurb.BinA028]